MTGSKKRGKTQQTAFRKNLWDTKTEKIEIFAKYFHSKTNAKNYFELEQENNLSYGRVFIFSEVGRMPSIISQLQTQLLSPQAVLHHTAAAAAVVTATAYYLHYSDLQL